MASKRGVLYAGITCASSIRNACEERLARLPLPPLSPHYRQKRRFGQALPYKTYLLPHSFSHCFFCYGVNAMGTRSSSPKVTEAGGPAGYVAGLKPGLRSQIDRKTFVTPASWRSVRCQEIMSSLQAVHTRTWLKITT